MPLPSLYFRARGGLAVLGEICCPPEVQERERRARIARGCEALRQSNFELEVGTDEPMTDEIPDITDADLEGFREVFEEMESEVDHVKDLVEAEEIPTTVGASFGKLRKTLELCCAKAWT
jgi:hypothetical protein